MSIGFALFNLLNLFGTNVLSRSFSVSIDLVSILNRLIRPHAIDKVTRSIGYFPKSVGLGCCLCSGVRVSNKLSLCPSKFSDISASTGRGQFGDVKLVVTVRRSAVYLMQIAFAY